jgi:hypothetical protein
MMRVPDEGYFKRISDKNIRTGFNNVIVPHDKSGMQVNFILIFR